MADNVEADAGSGGATFAADDISGVMYPRAKVVWGADGTATDTAAGAAALPIQDGGNSITVDGAVTVSGTATVSGSVTANAGTNLNTSALALEAGGNLAGAATSLAVLDDWDESDRAKVNPIVGQAGVAAGAGAVGATTQRATLASDDPAVVALQVLDDWDESDRAKVNPIVGQAGVAGGSGTVGATTQRVTLATDVALPTGTNSIGTVVDGGSGKTLKRAVVSLSADGDVVALVSSKRIKVYAFEIQSRSDSMNMQFKSNNAAGTALGIRWAFNTREGAMGSAVNPPAFLFGTAAGEALYADVTGTGTVDISVSYFDDDAT